MAGRTAFSWKPGNGPDPAALERLELFFPEPREPMGEAWFMTEERRMFDHLTGDRLGALASGEFEAALFEISSGTHSFGPFEEWRAWFHFLLPRLVPRAFDATSTGWLVESLVTAFVTQHPAGIREVYPGFRDDMLRSLGLSIMAPELWPGGALRVGGALHRRPRRARIAWGWFGPSGDLSSLLFFCLKYLEPAEVDAWVESFVSIRDPHWTAQLLAWLVAYYRMLGAGIEQPNAFDRLHPDPSWEASHVLNGHYTGHYSNPTFVPFLATGSIAAFSSALQRHIDEDLVLEWAGRFPEFPYLETEAHHLPDEFLQLHGAA